MQIADGWLTLPATLNLMNTGYPPTPKLSPHARDRAAEMGISTSRIKTMVRNHDLRRVCHDQRWLVTSQRDPDIAVVYCVEADGQAVVITVLWRSYSTYTRADGEIECSESVAADPER